MESTKRMVEVFTADCPICRDTLELVRQTVSGCGCEVVERRCEGASCCEPAVQYGVKAQPTIVVDGQVVFEGRPTADQVRDLLTV